MLKHALALTAALTLGALSAHAESMISTDITVSTSEVLVRTIAADKAGYLVVHESEDAAGTVPGNVIGHAPVKAGDNSDVAIKLEKKPKAGSKLIVMLHEEGDDNTEFDSADKPATAGRGPVQQVVTVE